MGRRTPLYENHQRLGARIVDFSGWDMPLHYGSQIQEHHQVRKDAGMFDVSHMGIVDVSGAHAHNFLRWVLANDVLKLKTPGKALYSCMLNEQGGVVDDLIVYELGENRYRLVVNAGTREKDLMWLRYQATKFSVELNPRSDLAILAIQGPHAVAKSKAVLPDECRAKVQALRPFEVLEWGDYCIARTGYTGEDGLELIVPNQAASQIWEDLLAAGVNPCGLAARDTLRLEAGMNLYGTDMDETVSPLESNLGWTVAFEPNDRDFIGRAALETKKKNITQRLVGLVLEQKGVLRNHQKVVVPGIGHGEITSGSFSPTLEVAIAFARVPIETADRCFVEIRGQEVPARVVKLPFVRRGERSKNE